MHAPIGRAVCRLVSVSRECGLAAQGPIGVTATGRQRSSQRSRQLHARHRTNMAGAGGRAHVLKAQGALRRAVDEVEGQAGLRGVLWHEACTGEA